MIVNMIYNGELTLPASAEKTKDGYYCLEENGRAWRVKRYAAYFYVENVEIEALQHNFGRYEIRLTGYPTGSTYEIVGEAHPHVNRRSACWGDLYRIAHVFLGENDIENFSGIVERLLRSYDPRSPYEGWWSEIHTCVACEGRINGSEHFYRCGQCGECLCRACVYHCLADLWWCEDCLPCRSTMCHRKRGCVKHIDWRPARVDRPNELGTEPPSPAGTIVQDELPF